MTFNRFVHVFPAGTVMSFDEIPADKRGTESGVWSEEPDRVSWVDTETGYKCLIIRMPDFGHLCGYVAVPKGSILDGKGYDYIERDVNVHGGVTFSGTPYKVDDTCTYFGFGCNHYNDYAPYMSMGLCKSGTYKDIEFVFKQVTSLAAQLYLENQTKIIVIEVSKSKVAEHVFLVMTNEGEFYRRHTSFYLKMLVNMKDSVITKKYQYLVPDAWRSLANIMCDNCEKMRPDEFKNMSFTVQDRDDLAHMLEEKYTEEVEGLV